MVWRFRGTPPRLDFGRHLLNLRSLVPCEELNRRAATRRFPYRSDTINLSRVRVKLGKYFRSLKSYPAPILLHPAAQYAKYRNIIPNNRFITDTYTGCLYAH